MSTSSSTSFVALLACGVLAPIAMTAAASDSGTLQTVNRISLAESERESSVGTVICTRRYTLRNKRWEKAAVMDVILTSDSSSGRKQYQILRMDAEGLQKKAFLKVLEAEVEGSRSGNPDGDANITPANYNFESEGIQVVNGKQYLVVKLKPKRNSKFLIAGKAWIDPRENAIVRVEGQTARSVSFWIGKPQITQSFRKVEEVWVAASNRSVSDVRFLGRTELSIEFGDYKIIRQPQRVARTSVRPGL